MSNIAIVTDSTAYLPAEVVSKHNIRVLPLKLHWDDKTYLDGIDITPSVFYQRLAKSPTLPTTSQTPVSAFLNVFEELSETSTGIVVILISSGISGTMDSALAAQKEFSRVPVEIIDTRSTAGAQAMTVIAAARIATAGGSLEDVAAIARQTLETMSTYFAVDTLEFLHKGGRIGGASRFFGSALQIKPILYLNDQGKIEALERVRTKKKALQRLVELTIEKTNGSRVCVGIMHSNAAEEADQVRAEIEASAPCDEIITLELSPVIGTHVGPGTIGVALYTV